jgi:hypothetical protein
MLRRQAGFGPPLTDPGYAHRLSGHCRKSHGGAYDLAAAFSK